MPRSPITSQTADDGSERLFFASTEPTVSRLYVHEHEWTEVGAERNPNGTWTAVFECAHCPDLGLGGNVGPVPPGMCGCGWVDEPEATTCADCGQTDRFVHATTPRSPR